MNFSVVYEIVQGINHEQIFQGFLLRRQNQPILIHSKTIQRKLFVSFDLRKIK